MIAIERTGWAGVLLAWTVMLCACAETATPNDDGTSGTQEQPLRLLSAGAASTWGDNSTGQLGNGTTHNRDIPGRVPGLGGVERVAAGAHHSLAIRHDGSLWAWGWNADGELGDGTTVDRLTPTQVTGLQNVVSVDGGRQFTIAATANGWVWTWGFNGTGQLGDGSYTGRSTPGTTGMTNVIAVAAGSWHAMALRSDGTVWTWGDNRYGQLGGGTANNVRPFPAQVPGLDDIVAVCAGYSHSVALAADGRIWAWGLNDSGQLGTGSSAYISTTPRRVVYLDDVDEIDCGFFHTMALVNGGSVWTWGRNFDGQLGNGTTTSINTPGPVPGLFDAVHIGASYNSSFALRSDGSLWGWGLNWLGEVGDGSGEEHHVWPVQAQIDDATQVTGGMYFTIARTR